VPISAQPVKGASSLIVSWPRKRTRRTWLKIISTKGWTIAVPAPTGGVHSGDPILVGGFFGIANYDAEQTLPVEITLGGVWQLPKAATVTFAVGAAVYFDATVGNVTSVSTRGNKLIGAATQCAGGTMPVGEQILQESEDRKVHRVARLHRALLTRHDLILMIR
jgi:predicted RecA/RadA family phage recombinase